MNTLEKLLEIREKICELIVQEHSKHPNYRTEDQGYKDCDCKEETTYFSLEGQHFCTKCGGWVRVVDYSDSKYDK